ncbi:LOW QUALITY PROTEIN: hypothetical protein HZS_901 [Henneguya salminicola]|nr:LOW QUALITY PROTEIN: hypothetical protein HZS_901 [Henneguya salminicola]
MDTITEEIKRLYTKHITCAVMTKCLTRLIASEDQFVVRGNHTCEKNSPVERVGSIPDIRHHTRRICGKFYQ